MGLIGNSTELSLQDLIQTKALTPGTCCIQIVGSRGTGVLFLSGGAVVHAQYDGKTGLPAAAALLSESHVEYRATSDVEVPKTTMNMPAGTLLLQTAVAVDESRRTPGSSLPARPMKAAPPEPEAKRGGRGRVLSAAFGAVFVAAAVAFVAFGRLKVVPNEAAAVAPAPVPEPAVRAPVEANLLTGAGDSLPVLLSGELPRTPSPSVALRPTVVVRLLVDEAGSVTKAEVYQPRAELSEFDRAALEAARNFKFQPARREGRPIAAFINWPVDFL